MKRGLHALRRSDVACTRVTPPSRVNASVTFPCRADGEFLNHEPADMFSTENFGMWAGYEGSAPGMCSWPGPRWPRLAGPAASGDEIELHGAVGRMVRGLNRLCSGIGSFCREAWGTNVPEDAPELD